MNFDIAKKVAYAACELDWLRKLAVQAEVTRAEASEAERHINTLHECAIELASVRAREIYTDPYDSISVLAGKNPGGAPVSHRHAEFAGAGGMTGSKA